MSVTMPTSLDIQWATNEEPVTFPQFQKTNSADATRTDRRQVLHGAAQQALTTSSPNRTQPREEADSSDDEGTGFVFPDTTPKRIRLIEPLDIRTHDELNYLHTDADLRLPPEFDSENDDDDDDNPMLADTGDDEVEEHEEQKKVNGPLVFAAVNKRDKNRNTNDAVEESEEEGEEDGSDEDEEEEEEEEEEDAFNQLPVINLAHIRAEDIMGERNSTIVLTIENAHKAYRVSRERRQPCRFDKKDLLSLLDEWKVFWYVGRADCKAATELLKSMGDDEDPIGVHLERSLNAFLVAHHKLRDLLHVHSLALSGNKVQALLDRIQDQIEAATAFRRGKVAFCKGEDKIIIPGYTPPFRFKRGELQEFIPWEEYIAHFKANVTDVASYNCWYYEVMRDLDRYCATIQCTTKPYVLVRTIFHDEELQLTVPYYEARAYTNFKESYMQFGVTPPGPMPIRQSIASLYLNWEGRRVYAKETMRRPTQDKRCFNTFTHLAITPEIAKDKCQDNALHCQPLLDFYLTHFCHGNEGLYNWYMDWKADALQNPTAKRRNAPVLQGTEGVGKGIDMQIIGKIFGEPYFYHPTSIEEVLGQFNNNLDNKLVCFCDEMVWGGDKKQAGILKKLLTEKTRTSNTKYGAIRPTENNTRFPSASNEVWVVPAGPTSRRWTVIEPDDWLAHQSNEVKRSLAEDYTFSFAHFLYNRNLSNFEDKHYETEGLQNQKKHSMPDIDAWWLDQLDNNLEQFLPLNKSKKKSDIWDAFRAKYPTRFTRDISFWIAFWAILPDPGYDKKNVRKITFTDNLSLENCRKHFDKLYRGDICRKPQPGEDEEDDEKLLKVLQQRLAEDTLAVQALTEKIEQTQRAEKEKKKQKKEEKVARVLQAQIANGEVST